MSSAHSWSLLPRNRLNDDEFADSMVLKGK